ncbi:hypothetical protein VN0387_12970 [Helicobacter pylori]
MHRSLCQIKRIKESYLKRGGFYIVVSGIAWIMVRFKSLKSAVFITKRDFKE